MNIQRKIHLNSGRDYIHFEIRGGRTVEITDLYVGSDRRQGIGTELITRTIASVTESKPQRLYVITRNSNTIAIAFYLSVGFKTLAILPNFYLDEEINTDGVMLSIMI